MKTIDKDVSNNDDDVNHKIDNENEYYNHDISIVEAEDEEKQLNETNIKNCTENNDDNDDDYDEVEGIRFVNYVDESQLDYVMSLVGRDLSEPYSSTFFILI